ncbi:MAG: 5-bromo-4-chloroindolyl phosphate hydrolysis family protein [Rhodobacteraceae bacterium]|nr:5-bromo-4-chloroindolyl phosphate hydrolysis family protein [Paracoccaceae bacterium]
MAERFGGKYSPGNAKQSVRSRGPFENRRPAKAATRANLLFLAPFALIPVAFVQDPVGLAIKLCAFGVLMAAALLTRQGLLAEEAYEARTIAKRPAIPRKLFGAVLTGAGLFLSGFSPDGSLLNPIIFGVLGAGLHILAFGLDPMTDKGADGIDPFQSERVAKAVDEAERHLAAMTSAIDGLNDRHLSARLEQFQATARDMFRTVENDPRDLTAARRYLGVYLLGARDATIKFAAIYGHSRDAEARADYETLLDDLERSFAERTEKLLIDDKSGLDVEIEVLRERLEREGVRTGLID